MRSPILHLPIVLAALAACSPALPLLAQTPVRDSLPDEARFRVNHANAIRLDLGSHGRTVVKRPRAEGTMMTFHGGYFVDRGGSVRPLASPIEIRQIHGIAIREGTRAGRGAAIGAAIGAALAIAGVIAVSGQSWESPSGGQAAGSVMLLTGIGAGIGALLGSTATRWRPVYP